MGQPITWQNVNQGDVSSAWRGLDTAAKSINGAFDGLTGLVKGAEATQAGNDVAIKNNNTQDYLNKLTGMFKSPEDLAAGLADGRVDQLKAGYGNAINHDQVRGAAEALLNTKYAQSKDAIGYNIFSTDAKQQPLVDEIQGYFKSGRPELIAKGNEMMAANPQIRVKSGLYGDANAAGQQVVERDRATTKFGREGETHADTLLTSANQRKNQTIQAEASRASAAAAGVQAAAATRQAKTGENSFLMQLQDKNNEMVLKAGTGLGTLNSHLASSPEGKETINKAIAGIKDPDAKVAAARIAQKLPTDAKAGDVATLLQTVEKAGLFSRMFGYGTNTSDEEVLKSFETVYRRGQEDTKAAEGLKARKVLYNAVAAQGIDGAQAAGNLLNRSLGIAAPAANTPAPATVAPSAPAPVVPAPPPAAVAQAASLRAMIPAPGAPTMPKLDTGFGQLGGGNGAQIGAYPTFTKAMQANIAAETAKAQKAEADGKMAKAAQHKAAVQALLKAGLQRQPENGYGD